jgi:hypothetical protein
MFDISRHLILKTDVVGSSGNNCHLYSGGLRFGLGRDTDCRGSGFSWFFLGFLDKLWGSTSVRPLPLPSLSFPVHYSRAVVCCCLRQHSQTWFRAPSGSMVIFLFVSVPCFEVGPPLPRRKGMTTAVDYHRQSFSNIVLPFEPIETDLLKVLPGNGPVNTFQHATI